MAEIVKGMLFGSGEFFHLAMQGRARRYALANVTMLGVLFGLSDMLGKLQNTPLPLDGKFAFITPLIFAVVGIVTMCGALIGCTLVYWAAARAFGGQGGLGLILDLVGLAALPLWVLAPLLNFALRYAASDGTRLALGLAIVPFFLWSFHLVRRSMIVGQGLSMPRATLAVAMVWIFSASSIYVFLP